MTNPFLSALATADMPLIMEVKLRDAAGRDLLGGRSVAEVVRGYASAGAPCLSVVTGRWFGGTDSLVSEVRAQTDLPILRKDFITRRAQVRHTVDLGADAVLLTAQLLPQEALRALTDHALSCGLTPFVEVTSAVEITALGELAARCIIAVNNKDITDQERGPARVQRSLDLLPLVLRQGCAVPVSASGIDNPDTARTLLAAGFRGLLVGTALLDRPDLSAWVALAQQSG